MSKRLVGGGIIGLLSHLLSVLTLFPLCVGCSEGLLAAAFRFLRKQRARIVESPYGDL